MKIIQCYRICGNSFFFHVIGMNIFERNIRLFEKKVRRILYLTQSKANGLQDV